MGGHTWLVPITDADVRVKCRFFWGRQESWIYDPGFYQLEVHGFCTWCLYLSASLPRMLLLYIQLEALHIMHLVVTSVLNVKLAECSTTMLEAGWAYLACLNHRCRGCSVVQDRVWRR